MLDERTVQILLGTLCEKLGFCLPPAEQERLVEDPPDSVQEFTDAVFRAEGLDPRTADRALYRRVRDEVRRVFP